MNHNTHQQQQQQSSILDSYESSENALMDSFKAAALKVTTLYKDSLVQNRKAYASGYQQALQDLYEFISSHPCTTVSHQDTFVSPTEHGLLPVQDLLAYARQRNTQLTCDMGVSASMDSSSPSSAHTSVSPQPQQSYSASSSDALSTRSHQQQQQQQGFSDRTQSSDLETAGMVTAISSPNKTPSSQPTSVPGVIGAAVKNAFHPFQIDPNTQFTFSLPPNYHTRGQPCTTMSMADCTPTEGLKRRITPNELSFMGRSLNSMNIDNNWNEPAMKRRTKRDD
ncbi:hypothetical protein BCR42DRAFT_488178 [Absidia repens]|uniref:Uncharacterized protein n=1 Tax=Absidia repens TaxID=90262 RepID=A0A1X2IV30_9FUNG|nr:hypothetical protein BCR42DRAFT_488178 [Absidia repens]